MTASTSKPDLPNVTPRKRKKIIDGLSAPERKKFEESEAAAKETVYNLCRELDDVEGKIDRLRERYNKELGIQKKKFKETINRTHNNSPVQKAEIHDATLKAWTEYEDLMTEKSKALDPLTTTKRELTTRRRTAIESIDQMVLNFGSDGES